MAQAVDRDPSKQVLFYDPGVGTLPRQGLITSVAKSISKVAGLAFGAGILSNVFDGYRFLAQQWQPGDRIYLFGFSRGAYTARALAAMLHMFGLLPPNNDNLLPYFKRIFASSRGTLDASPEKAQEFWRLTDKMRETFARDIDGSPDRRCPVHFVGV